MHEANWAMTAELPAIASDPPRAAVPEPPVLAPEGVVPEACVDVVVEVPHVRDRRPRGPASAAREQDERGEQAQACEERRAAGIHAR